MSKKHFQEQDKGKRPAGFIIIDVEVWQSKAWRRMSHGAKWLYCCLLTKHSIKKPNNGHIYLPQRKAMELTGSGFKQIGRWFRELVHYGFIIQTTAGCLGISGKGRAPRWRFTHIPGEQSFESSDGEITWQPMPATREFQLWDGTAFRDFPAMEKHSRTAMQKHSKRVLWKSIAVKPETAMQKHSKCAEIGAMEKHSKSRCTISMPSQADAADEAAAEAVQRPADAPPTVPSADLISLDPQARRERLKALLRASWPLQMPAPVVAV